MPKQNFLFLQSLRSPFFARLAQSLVAANCSVHKVQYAVGDHLYWPIVKKPKGLSVHRCNIDLEKIPNYYADLFAKTGATDLVLFGDCRPVHRPAIRLATQSGLNVHVFEEGYFRPDWITLERNGVNGFSDLPCDPDWYRDVARSLPAHTVAGIDTGSDIKKVGPAMPARVCHDVLYNTANLLNPVFYPRYQSHVPHSTWAEYTAYASRYLRVKQRQQADQQTIDAIVGVADTPYFLVTLQIPGDSQLTLHSRFGDQQTFIAEVMQSFVRCAPSDSVLVFKNHPLDPGMARFDKVVAQVARELDCAKRVRFLETGHLPTLLDHAAGFLAINSTSIGQALFHRCPTMVLGQSMFNLPGLSFQGPLDAFWCDAEPPDNALFKSFQRVVIHATQINGGLYNKTGIDIAIGQALPHLLAPTSRLETLLAAYPPNLSAAS